MKNFSIGKKTILGVSFLLVANILILLFNIKIVQLQSEKIEQNLEKIDNQAEKLAFLNEFDKNVINLNLDYMDAIVDKDKQTTDQEIIDNHESFFKELETNKQKYLSYLETDTEKENFNLIFKDLELIKMTADKLFIAIKNKEDKKVFDEHDDVLDASIKDILSKNKVIIARAESEYKKEVENSHKASSSAFTYEVISVVFMLVLGIGFMWLFVRSINKSLTTVSQKLKSFSDNLKVEADSVKNSSVMLSEAATEQSASLQETVSSIDQISAMVQKNADSANSSTVVTEKSYNVANLGKKTVEGMIDSINHISSSNNEITSEMRQNNDELVKIVNVINEIGNKTKVINDIVFQTKLLSFNASVEAARAGEHGKGFSVVAEEVGNLAAMSGKAAQEITEMLNKSIGQVNEMVVKTKSKVEILVKNSQEKINIGITTANDCGKSLDEILQNVSQVNAIVKDIANASKEQSQGIKEITKAMQELDEVTHRNSSIASSTSQMSINLQTQSKDLNQAVEELMFLAGINSAMIEGKKHEVKKEHSEKVISIDKNRNKEKMIAIPKTEPVTPKSSESKGLKVAGYDTVIPDQNDSRFEDL